MRRRLVLLSLATTVLVVVSLVVPLGLLVKEQAANRAIVDAENEAQSVAGLVALAAAVGDNTSVSDVVGQLPEGTVVVLADGTLIGEPADGQSSLVDQAARSGSTVAGSVPGGWEIALPVVGTNGVAVVDSFVTSETLGDGVVGAWALLGILALVLIGVAVLVADRIGQGLVRPIEDLAASAHRLADGDLNTRVDPADPEEIREVGEAFNNMATRLDGLLQEERESAADLSHRLRTPLTSLRLQADSLSDEAERRATLAQVDRLERAMDRVIELSRSRRAEAPQTCDLDEVVERRVGFWRLLAEEQHREVEMTLAGPGLVERSAEDIEAVVDILIDNVFSHTPPGTSFEVVSGSDDEGAWLEVRDRGPGLGGGDPVRRGISGAGSSGLGLDIVRKIAGRLDANDRPEGGAVVRARLVGYERASS